MKPIRPSREIQISSSSVLNLKTELISKQAQLKPTPASKSVNLSKLKIAGESITKPKKPVKVHRQEEHEVDKSYLALQRKAMLYQEMQERGLDMEDEEEVEELRNEFSSFVEVTDEFGRTTLADPATLPKDPEPAADSGDVPKDTESRGWVKASKPSYPDPQARHFQSTKEKRTLGTGFYQFSQDEDKRESQMRELNRLRQETIISRSAAQVAAETRKTKLEERRDMIRKRNLKNAEKKFEGLFEEVKRE
jgi:Domain of unknown function (DUF4078)